MQHERAGEALARLRASYPSVGPSLNYRSPYELLVAAVLSAQSTDRQVNRVTPALFAAYPTPAALAAADPADVAAVIKSLGLYKAKSKNLVALAQKLVGEFGGQVPADLESLLKLDGVGRKVALVVLANAFGRDVIAVDTHVFRVANRLGLASAPDVRRTEDQLMAVLPAGSRGLAHHLLIRHGRQVCHARRPNCADCSLADICAYHLGAREAAADPAGEGG